MNIAKTYDVLLRLKILLVGTIQTLQLQPFVINVVVGFCFLFFPPCFYCAYGTSFQTTTSSVITFCHLSAHLKPVTVGYGITSLARSV